MGSPECRCVGAGKQSAPERFLRGDQEEPEAPGGYLGGPRCARWSAECVVSAGLLGECELRVAFEAERISVHRRHRDWLPAKGTGLLVNH